MTLFSQLFLAVFVHAAPPHMDLDMTGFEYEWLMDQRAHISSEQPLDAFSDKAELQPILDLGKRNLNWLRFMNAKRSEADKISISAKDTQTGTPIETPNRSNVTIIKDRLAKLKSEIPSPMFSVLFENQSFTDDPPVELQEFRKWSLAVDKIYQSASRWLMGLPYHKYYAKDRSRDIRGFYYLNKESDLETKLKTISQLAGDKQLELKGWVVGLCQNTGKKFKQCQERVEQASKQNKLFALYNRLLPFGQKVYDSYFKFIYKTPAVWTSQNANEMTVDFLSPNNQVLEDFLKINIEDEYRWNSWNLKMKFLPKPLKDTPYLEFVEGTTPHVTFENGAHIVMDGNAPLTEYDVNWTIRHEFGHILGFPDCYIEFYEEESGAMVNYQIDITDLMCSRRGAFKQRHFDQLKDIYFK